MKKKIYVYTETMYWGDKGLRLPEVFVFDAKEDALEELRRFRANVEEITREAEKDEEEDGDSFVPDLDIWHVVRDDDDYVVYACRNEEDWMSAKITEAEVCI